MERRQRKIWYIVIACLGLIFMAGVIALGIIAAKEDIKKEEQSLSFDGCIISGNGIDCFMISVIQSLSNLKSYINFLKELGIKKNNNSLESILISVQSRMAQNKIIALDSDRGRILDRLNNNAANTGASFSSTMQNDSEEFLKSLLQTIEQPFRLKITFV